MIDNFLIIIPARGGSKRIPDKNIKKIFGYPMIYWPLKELSKGFNSKNILISTDDTKIVKTVEKIGINIPFLRPKYLSDDFTGTMPVVEHALGWYEKNVKKIDYVIVVYPTALMLKFKNIKEAIKILEMDNTCELVMSATNFPSPIQRGLYLDKNGYAKMFSPKNYTSRSQDLINSFHDAGQFYVWRSSSVRNKKTLVNSKVKLFHINREFVVDIDTEEDIKIVKKKLKYFKLDKFKSNWKFK